MYSTFRRNLLIGYGVSLVLLTISSVASYISISSLLSNTRQVNQTNNLLRKLDAVLSATKDGESGQRGYLLTNDVDFLEPYRGARERAVGHTEELISIVREHPVQRRDVAQLKDLVQQRFSVLQKVIDNKNTSGQINSTYLEEGRVLMERLRNLAQEIGEREEALLVQRTESMNRFAAATPILIVVAAVLGLIITIVSFLRVSADFTRREKLQKELEEKDKYISQRIAIIQDIADKIAAGNYKTRVTDEGKDTLGSLGLSLNTMAEELDRSFQSLNDTEWQQTGVAGLNHKMLGERNLKQLTASVLQYLADYTGSDVGAFYLTLDQEHFELSATVGLDDSRVKRSLTKGEGFAGRSALTGKTVLIEDLPDTDLVVNYSAGSIRPKAVVAVPVYYETRLKGVIELASLKNYNPVTQRLLESAVYNIGMAIHSARDHQRLQELLEQTQAQSEELQVQHSELENINTELEAQAEKLQASEEELKVQQEELQQANQELEERSRLLEEKNELILERNREIQAKARELELSTRYKSEFLANMSHELRTPLNSILLLSRLLTENHEGNLSNEQIEYARVIQGSGNGLLTLIDEILDLSKIESGKMELEYGQTALEDVVQALEGMFAPVAKDKGVHFAVIMGSDVPRMIETDRLRLEQILRNLLSNALKFTAQGSVTLSIQNRGTTISFEVKDTGIGIPADKQQTIFEAFQQADGSTRRKFGGTGLGLSISRELAKLLGGEIRLESEEGEGSTFSLVLPLERGAVVLPAELAAEPLAKSEQSQREVVQTEETPSPTDKIFTTDIIPPSIPDDRSSIGKDDRVILIVEDDVAFAGALLDYTRKKGYKGVVSVRGDEALPLARQYRPLGILLDVQLPVKSGWEVMEELKGDPATKPIPVHMMSSHQVKTRSLAKGAIDFINKPVAFEKMGEIFEKIEQALSRHPRKVLIVEENPKHAQALSYFLETFNVNAEIRNNVGEGIQALNQNQVDCVILDMGVPAQHSYDTLDEVRKTPGLENVPIIIFTGKNLSHVEEMRIKQYADSIVIKTAHSYQRILDEVSLFLHLVEEHKGNGKATRNKKMKGLEEVLRDKTVLVADDDVRNIFSLTRALENYGMHIVSAMDGKDALKQLQEHPEVDIVLMDMMMPEMDGYESTRRIRELPKYKNLPIIAVTAKAMTGDREKCISAGASDYITKPVDVDQLISLLRVWLYQ
jgi:signal transduction histidine kinase/DNA-binding response OmpR family regulator/CHASE3 domain sensor protein